jgi:hypothetical protein
MRIHTRMPTHTHALHAQTHERPALLYAWSWSWSCACTCAHTPALRTHAVRTCVRVCARARMYLLLCRDVSFNRLTGSLPRLRVTGFQGFINAETNYLSCELRVDATKVTAAPGNRLSALPASGPFDVSIVGPSVDPASSVAFLWVGSGGRHGAGRFWASRSGLQRSSQPLQPPASFSGPRRHR